MLRFNEETEELEEIFPGPAPEGTPGIPHIAGYPFSDDSDKETDFFELCKKDLEENWEQHQRLMKASTN